MVQHDLLSGFLAELQICRKDTNNLFLTALLDPFVRSDLAEILHRCLNWSKQWKKL